jgi:hypothetical protein
MKRYRGISDAQANAEALARRSAPYAVASEVSFKVAWDYTQREPENLREAVRMVRRAYADEVPTKLHEGYDSIGEGGTPKMTAKAEGYLFGNPTSSDAGRDAETGEPDLVSYYHAPFRAALHRMSHGDEASRKRAAIVQHVTIGQQGPQEAAIAEDVPSWCAKVVAEDAIRAFLRDLTDIKVSLRRERDVLPENVTAA